MNETDDLPPPEELEQLARILAMDGSLGHHDARTVAAVLRRAAVRRRPGGEGVVRP